MTPPAKLNQQIDASQIVEFQERGAVCLRSPCHHDWVSWLRDGVDEAMANPSSHSETYTQDNARGKFFGDLDIWRTNPYINAFVLHSPAAEIAASVMQSSRINFFYDQLLVKEPGAGEATPWHQDQPYWSVSGRQVCSIWLTLDDIPETLSLRFVVGSHLWNTEYNPQHFKDKSPYQNTGLPALPDIDTCEDQYEIAQWDMAAGDCIVFQSMMIHGSRGNTSENTRRRALATRWAGDDARYLVRPGEVGFPTENPGLKDGDRLDCDNFPVVWPRPG